MPKRKIGTLLSVTLAPLAKRFIAGTTLVEALDVVKRFKEEGFLTTLDHLGENVTDEAASIKAAEHYVVMLKALKERGLERNVSVKLSQMGLGLNRDLCFKNLERIVRTAQEVGGFVRVDMEGSDVTQPTLDTIVHAKTTRATPVGAVLQAMLLRTPKDLVDLIESDITIRLCKGAYKEPKKIAYQRMSDVRREFLALSKRLLMSGLYHGIATHDKIIIENIKEFIKKQGLLKEHFEFQMLLGIRPSFQRELIKEGYRLRIYIPFGRAWLPYTLRRIHERKENLWFAVKSLFQR